MKRRSILVFLAALLAAQALFGAVAPASAVTQPAGSLVSQDPADFTPHVLDGQAYSIVQVGSTMIMGGTFTQARNNGDSSVLSRSRLLAFDANTGTISSSFNPAPNGTINVVLPAGDGETVFVGGSFTSIAGQTVKNLARIRVSDGSVVTTFNGGSPTGAVKDLRLAKGKLWVGGAFTHINGAPRAALATLNPTTGATDPYFNKVIAGVHKAGSYTTVMKLDMNPQQTRMVVMGNFDTLDGVKNHQLFLLDISGSSAQAADWRTSFYQAACAAAFDSYMRDVDFSPDGSYFVVSTTGAYGGYGESIPCDTAARFNISDSGSGVSPAWIDYTGGDTSYAVEVTDTAVYIGGHQRWWNNSFANNVAGAGAVSRPGIAALNPLNGLPFSWNPTRDRGIGVFDMLSTEQGLWLVSDTDRIGAYEYHARVALMPKDGTAVPEYSTAALPNDVYAAGPTGFTSDPSVLYRVNAGGAELSASTGVDWSGDDGTNSYATSHSVSSYTTVRTVDSTVPSSTPSSVFSTAAWDAWDAQEMNWSFPVPAGTAVQVRLYFVNRDTTTAQAGQRVFNVAVDGASFLDRFDIVAAVGNNVGTMRSKDVVSDGSVDISFGHITSNPLVSAIEIVRTDLATTATGALSKTSFDGTTAGAQLAVADGDLAWNTVRGTFMVNGYLYTAFSDGTFSRRSYDGTTFGSAELVNTQDKLVVLQQWHTDIASATGLFYDSGRIYYTMSGNSNLYYRYFNVESGVVGAERRTASSGVSGINFTKVKGMFLGGTKLYWATNDGNLHAIDWANNSRFGYPVADTAEVVSGPMLDGASWGARALFLFQDADGKGAPQPPVPAFSLSCTDATCTVDGSASTVAGSTISSYDWNWGDGATTSGATSTHTYAGRGTQTVTLTVTAASGATAELTQQVSTNLPPVAALTSSCDLLACTFDASTSTDDDGIATYQWDFGDGASSTEAAPQHSYATPGEYSVMLTVVDSDGASATATAQVKVVAAPVADFTATCTSLTCEFDATASVAPGSEIAEYNWDFGDGSSGTGEKPQHEYTANGDYSVVLTLTTLEGLTTEVTKVVPVVRVNVAPVADFTRSCTQLECTFDAGDSADSDGTVASYAWDFGDGESGTGESPSHQYAAAGKYSVKLTVTDNDGATDSREVEVEVSQVAVSFVAAESSNGNRISHTVSVPNSVQAGDRLVLFLALNNTVDIEAPSGWTEVRSNDAGSFLGRVWTKVATADDAGSTVRVAVSAYAKGDLTVAAYRSTTGTVSIAESEVKTASYADSLSTPSLAVGAGGIGVNYVAWKSSNTLTADVPGSLTQRSSSTGKGGGGIYTWTADSADYLDSGTFGGKTVSLSGTANRALAYGLLLRAS